MKILFIHNMAENLGIEYLSSVLKNRGHTVELAFDPFVWQSDAIQAVINVFPFLKSVQNNKEMIEKILAKVCQFVPDLIGFSVYANNLDWMKSLADRIKKIKKIPIVCGGPQVTIIPDKILELPYVDYVIAGEGEYALADLADALERRLTVQNLPNIGFKENGKNVINPVRDYVYDLDRLPFPDKLLFYEKVPMFEDCYRILTSRGCPYKCTYCVNNVFQDTYRSQKRHLRFRGIENIISELKWAKSRGKAKVIFFEDDIFTLKKNRLTEFLGRYSEDIGLPFWCFIHPNTIDRDTARIIAESGCWMANMGMQSGSSRIRSEIFGRKETDKNIIDVSNYLSDFNVKLAIDTIFGAPTETLEDLDMNLDIIRTIMPDRLNTYWLVYYPTTKLAKLALEHGDITREYYANLEKGFTTHMSDGGNVIKNKKIYKTYELISIIMILFRIRSAAVMRLCKQAVPYIPMKSFWKRIAELIISVRNRDYKFFYLIRYVFARKQVP